MEPGKVIYTDGKDVVVTDISFKVKNVSYDLNGITNLGFWTIRPDRGPAYFLMLFGLLMAGCGYYDLIPVGILALPGIGDFTWSHFAGGLGIAIIFIGLMKVVFSKEKYAVRVGTPAGEKNALVSNKREYIAHIVDAIHSAYDLGASAPTLMDLKK